MSFKMWMAQYVVNSLNGSEIIPIDDFLQEVDTPKKGRSAEEILKDFEPFLKEGE